MNDVTFEGNSASEGNTLYVVWRSVESMEWNEFSSFEGSSEEEAKVETRKRGIVGMGESVSGGGMSGFAVCTQIEISESGGTLVVEVMEEEGAEEEGEEESGGEGCMVGMEGGEVSGEVEWKDVSGEGVVVYMGNALTRVLQGCENIEIVMNVTYGGWNG